MPDEQIFVKDEKNEPPLLTQRGFLFALRSLASARGADTAGFSFAPFFIRADQLKQV
jgi:hypothetical protein